MSYRVFNKPLVIFVLFLFVCGAVFSGFSAGSKEIETQESLIDQYEKLVTCYVFDKKGNSKQEVVLSSDDFERFYSMFEELNNQVTYSPFSSETDVLKVELVDLIDNMDMIPEDSSKEDIISLLTHPLVKRRPLFSLLPSNIYNGRGSAFFCNFATWGEGSQFPVIILPRLIPILLVPIPRVAMRWNAVDGITSCGGLLSGKGFIAEGAQKGTALGFWGIGFSVFLPPVMSFGFIGYALYATASAEIIHPWPPNRPPVVSGETPADGSINVPVDLSELSFSISDLDGDRMNYTVTTSPNIGSGSGNNVADGTYTIPVSGLNSNTEYSWHIVVSDGEDTTEETFSFHTAIEAPFVSEPSPVDGDSWVSVDLTELSFKLEDLQGDLMDYTVETAPYIGSGSGNGVVDGTYTVAIGGLEYTRDYTWFVNVTDGKFWTRRIFVFKTQPVLVFDPFNEGWLYRKKITVDHNLVEGNLSDFPVLVSVVDSDLKNKAQVDGDDILFMDGSGVANRLLHEIEYYNDASGELIAWVKLDYLDKHYDIDFYIYYGNPVCDNQQYPELAWDSSFIGVYHMNEASGDIFDITANDNTFSVVNAPIYLQDGKMGYCLDFDGDDDYFQNINMNLKSLNEFTLSAWIQPDTVSGEKQCYIFSSKYDSDNDIRLSYHPGGNDNSGYCGVYDDGTIDGITDYTHTFNADNWYFYASTCSNNNGDSRLYMDDECVGIDDSVNFKFNNLDNKHRIGHRTIYNTPKYFDGCLDEIKISKIARSEEWIFTEYNNQYNPSSFMDFGPEESGI